MFSESKLFEALHQGFEFSTLISHSFWSEKIKIGQYNDQKWGALPNFAFLQVYQSQNIYFLKFNIQRFWQIQEVQILAFVYEGFKCGMIQCKSATIPTPTWEFKTTSNAIQMRQCMKFYLGGHQNY